MGLRLVADLFAGADVDALDVATTIACASAAETAQDRRAGARLVTGTCCTGSADAKESGLGPTIDFGLTVGVEVVRDGARLNLAEGSSTGMDTSICSIFLERVLVAGLTWRQGATTPAEALPPVVAVAQSAGADAVTAIGSLDPDFEEAFAEEDAEDSTSACGVVDAES